MLFKMISVPFLPSRTTRVGATSRSPTPALAADGKARSGAKSALAPRTDPVHLFISAIPILLRNGVTAELLLHNGLYSVNHASPLGEPRRSLLNNRPLR